MMPRGSRGDPRGDRNLVGHQPNPNREVRSAGGLDAEEHDMMRPLIAI
jgi:hypothetical protein